MGTVYSTLGARLDVVEMLDGLMQGADRDLVKIWQKMNAPRFDNIMLKTKTVAAVATPAGIKVTFAPAEEGVKVPEPQTYDLVLQAVGRTPMVGTHAGDMIGEIALAIEMGADAIDIGKTIYPHLTLGESIGMAAEIAHGSCTDVPPARK